MQRVVVAVDSFKGCLSSEEIAAAITLFFAQNYPSVEVVSVPIADGGEGMVGAIDRDRMDEVVVGVSDPLGRIVDAAYLLDDQVAIIEMATAAGLTLVEPALRDPSKTTTYGVGQMIADALDRGARRFIVGIGGSATNDAGIGMLSALGFRFLDEYGELIGVTGDDLIRLRSIDLSEVDPRLSDTTFEVACDVRNPLYGEQGAAHIYAAQKGATPAMVEQLDVGLRAFAAAVGRLGGVDVNSIEGAGAAGGLGAAFYGLLGGKLRRGIDLILDFNQFDHIIKDADLIITGEGRLDRQTLMGKAPHGVLQAGVHAGVPVVAIAGQVDNGEALLAAGFVEVIETSPRSMPLLEAMEPQIATRNILAQVERLVIRRLLDPRRNFAKH